jgi:endo-1,4-beta-D-glucanase Y
MAISIVSGQNVSASGTTSATSAHFNNTVVAGNAIIVAVTTSDVSNGATSVTDSASSVYVKSGTSYQSQGNTVELWIAQSALSTGSASQTVTVNGTSGDAVDFIAQEVNGFAGTVYLDQQTGTSTASGTSLTTSNVTTGVSGEMLIGIGAQNNTNRPYTAGSGYSIIAQSGGTAGIALEYEIAGSAGLYNAAMTIDTAQPWDLALWTLSPTPLVVTVPTPPYNYNVWIPNNNVGPMALRKRAGAKRITPVGASVPVPPPSISAGDSTTTSETYNVVIPPLTISVSDSTTTSESYTETAVVTLTPGIIFHDAATTSANYGSVGANTTVGGNNGMFGPLGASGSIHIAYSGGNYVFEGIYKTLTAPATIFQFYYRPASTATIGTGNTIFTVYTDSTFTNSSSPIRIDIAYVSATTYKLSFVDDSNSYTTTLGTTTLTLGTAIRITIAQTSAGWSLYLNNNTTPEISYSHTQSVIGYSNFCIGTNSQNATGSYSGVADFDEIWASNPYSTPTNAAGYALEAWHGYVQNHISAEGQAYRGPVDGYNLGATANTIDTVSETVAYTLSLAVQNNDQANFKQVDNFTLANLLRYNSTSTNSQNNSAPTTALNLMVEHYNSANTDGKGIGTIYDANFATDAEVQRGLALLWAHGRWGSSAYTVGSTNELATPNYLQRALNVIGDLRNYAFVNSPATGYNYLVNDSLQQGNTVVQIGPDYIDTGAFALFAQYDASHGAFWNAAVQGAYDIWNKAETNIFSGSPDSQSSSAGLMPDWVALTVSTATVSSTRSTYGDPNYGYNAFRAYPRMRDAYTFYGDNNVLTPLRQPKSFFTSYYGTNSNIAATFNHDGTNAASYVATLFTYAAYWSIYTGDTSNTTASSIFTSSLSNLFYQEPYGSIMSNAPSSAQYSYFDQSWNIRYYMESNALWSNYGQVNNLTISTSDSTTTSESYTVTLGALASPAINVSDSTTTSESYSAYESTTINASDSTTSSENYTTATSNLQISTSDSTATSESYSESISAVTPLTINVADSTTTSESIALLIPALYISVSDSSTTSDVVMIYDGEGIFVNDSTATSESINIIKDLAVNVYDSTQVFDSVSNNGLLFDGQTSYGTFNMSNTNVAGASSWSFLATVNIIGSTTRGQSIIDVGMNYFGGTGLEFQLGPTTPNLVAYGLKPSAGLSSSSAISYGVVQTVGATWDGTTLRMYINGVLDASTYVIPSTGNASTTGYLGDESNSPNFRSVYGAMYDIRLFNGRVLTGTDFTNYASGTLPSSTSQSLVYVFEDGSNTVVTDKSGLGGSASMSNTVAITGGVAISAAISVTDATTTSESLNLLEIAFISASDSTTTSESITAVLASLVTVSDSTAASETLKLLTTAYIAASDSTVTSENVSASPVSFINVSDSTATLEQLIVTSLSLISVSDATTTSESIALNETVQINISDSSVTSESVAAFLPFLPLSVSDSSSTSESVTVFIANPNVFIVTVSDATATAEAITAVIPFYLISASDASTTSDSVSTNVAVTVYAVDYAFGSLTNLEVYSQSAFNTQWHQNVFQSLTITDNKLTAPDSTLTASQFTASATSAGVYQTPLSGLGAYGQVVTYSVYIQYISGATSWLLGTDNGNANFNVQTGTLISANAGVTTTITSAGGGWFRYSVTFTLGFKHVSATSPSFIIYTSSGALSTTVGIWGAQAQYGLVPTTYQPTTSVPVTTQLDTVTLLESVALSVADASATSDTAIASVLSFISVSDNTATLEQYIETLQSFVRATDATVTSENLNLLELSYITVSDATATSEFVLAYETTQLSVTDSTASNESYSLTETISISGSDSTATSETINAYTPLYFISTSESTVTNEVYAVLLGGQGIYVGDSSATSDNVTLFIPTLFLNASENTLTSENYGVQVGVQVGAQDSTSTSESYNVSELITIASSDSTVTSESLALKETVNINVSDSTTTSETVTVYETNYVISASDSTATNENYGVYENIAIAVSDNTATSESYNQGFIVAVIVADASATFETYVLNNIQNIVVSDSTATSESYNILETTYYIQTSDSTASNESIATTSTGNGLYVSDSTSTSESITLFIQTLNIVASDSSATSESYQLYDGEGIYAVDTTVSSETVNVIIPTCFINVSDSFATSDSVNPLILSTINVSDSTVTSESEVTVLLEGIQVSENTVASESINLIVPINLTTSENTTTSETYTEQITVYINVFDSIVTNESELEFEQGIFAPQINVSDTSITSELVRLTDVLLISVPEYLTVQDNASLYTFSYNYPWQLYIVLEPSVYVPNTDILIYEIVLEPMQ